MALLLTYSLQNARGRSGRSILTALIIALVVAVCSLLLALISSLKQSLVTTGEAMNLVVLRKGSGSDGSSQISLEAYRALRFWDGIARDAANRPLISPELVVQPIFRTHAGRQENVLVRGVEPVALAVHSAVRIAEGRMLTPRSGEAVVGRGVRGRYRGTEVGSEVAFGRRRWKVVGILDASGSAFESEVWVDVRELADDAKRPWPYSALRLRAANTADVRRLQRRINDDPRFALTAEVETEYYARLAETANSLYLVVVSIALLSGIGAGFGAANTMYAAVQARRAEIGTLRALGFSRGAILCAFQMEAVALALAGFGLGVLLSFGGAVLVRVLIGSVGFRVFPLSTSVVILQLSAADLGAALLVATLIGLGGGLGPAWRAARLRPIDALRH